jgi:leukotriene-A4 hydrolase
VERALILNNGKTTCMHISRTTVVKRRSRHWTPLTGMQVRPNETRPRADTFFQAWFYGEGVELPVQVDLDLSLAKQAYALADRWDAARALDISQTSFSAADVDGFNSNQKAVFLERLQTLPPLPASHIVHLGTLYKVADSSNAEIRFRFYELALRDPSSAPEHLALDAARWVVGDDGSGVIKGRAKFCRPVFRSIARIDRDLAVEYFEKHKAEFHPIARKLIEKVSWAQSVVSPF